jgi:RND family efflux transporter MFP subunit
MKRVMNPVWAIALGCLILLSCKGEPEKVKESVRPVKAIQVGETGPMNTRGYPGLTQVKKEAELSFRVSGPLNQLNITEGKSVNKGELLAQVDPRDFQVDLAAKEGRNTQAKAEMDRYETLYAQRSVSKNDLDMKIAAYKEASAAYISAQNALDDTRLVAPFSGFVGKLNVENFEEIRAKQVILTLVDVSAIEVKTHVPENVAVLFRYYDSYEVVIETYPDTAFSAQLKEIEKTAGPEGFALYLYLDHKNVVGGDHIIGPGFSCRVNINIRQDESLASTEIVVPLAAVMEGVADTSPSVWVIDTEAMTVSKRFVEIEDFVDSQHVKISGGLEIGEWIATAGIHQLIEGQKVKFLQERL